MDRIPQHVKAKAEEIHFRFKSMGSVVDPDTCAWTVPFPAVHQYRSIGDRAFRAAYGTQIEQLYTEEAIKLLIRLTQSFVAIPLEESKRTNPDTGKSRFTQWLFVIVKAQGAHLFPRVDEPCIIRTEYSDPSEPPLSVRARRLVTPSWLKDTSQFVFHVQAPSNKPNIKVPELPIANGLDSALAAFKAERAKFTFRGKLIVSTSSSVTAARFKGIEAITVASQISKTVSGDHLRWLLNFDTSPKSHNLGEIFSAVGHLADRVSGLNPDQCRNYLEAAKAESFAEMASRTSITHDISDWMMSQWQDMGVDQRKAILSNADCPFGHKVILGCPGSGKTTTGLFLCALFALSTIDEKHRSLLRRDPPSEADKSATPENAGVLSSEPKTSSENNPDATKSIAPRLKRAKVLVLINNNELLGIVQEKFSSLVEPFKLRLVKAEPLSHTRQHLDSDSDAFDPFEDIISFSNVELEQAQMEREMRQGRLKYRTAHSISSRVAFELVMNKTSEDVKAVLEFQALRKADPAKPFHSTQYGSRMFDIIRRIYLSSDVIFATPYAAASLVDHVKLQPDVLWVDECGRTSEVDLFHALATYGNVLCRLQTGDLIQPRPVVLSLNGHRRNNRIGMVNPFGPQLALPMVRRMTESGAFTADLLHENFRSHASLVALPSRLFYKDAMFTSPRFSIPEDVDKRYTEFFQTIFPGSSGRRGWLDNIGEHKQDDFGSSFTNKSNALLIAELVALVFHNKVLEVMPVPGADGKATVPGRYAHILIITDYEAQKHVILQTLHAHLRRIEWVSELVRVSTTDSSMGAEATIVIHCHTRSKGIGHTGDPERNAVSTTRARFLEFVIGSSEVFSSEVVNPWLPSGTHPTAETLREIRNDCKSRNAVRQFTSHDWLLDGPKRYCGRCAFFHSSDQQCEPVCRWCGEKGHCVRWCKKHMYKPRSPAVLSLQKDMVGLPLRTK